MSHLVRSVRRPRADSEIFPSNNSVWRRRGKLVRQKEADFGKLIRPSSLANNEGPKNIKHSFLNLNMIDVQDILALGELHSDSTVTYIMI